MTIERSHNTPTAIPTVIPADLEDKIMRLLPQQLGDWLRYDAIGDSCTVEVFRAWRAGHRTDDILAHLRGQQRKQTRRDYGAAHPQASFV